MACIAFCRSFIENKSGVTFFTGHCIVLSFKWESGFVVIKTIMFDLVPIFSNVTNGTVYFQFITMR